MLVILRNKRSGRTSGNVEGSGRQEKEKWEHFLEVRSNESKAHWSCAIIGKSISVGEMIEHIVRRKRASVGVFPTPAMWWISLVNCETLAELPVSTG